MTQVEREVLEVDVLFVGAGPACLAGAYHLTQQVRAHDAAVESGQLPGDKIGDIEIAVLEKGSEIGMHLLSGAVIDPRALRELMPDFEEQGFPYENKVDADSVHYLNASGSFRLPITPPPLQNHGNYIASLHKVGRWLGEKVEEVGVNIFCGHQGFSYQDSVDLGGGKLCNVGLGMDAAFGDKGSAIGKQPGQSSSRCQVRLLNG